MASITFHVTAGRAQSLPRAPFGGFEFFEQVHDEALAYWWRQVTFELKELKVKTIVVKIPPVIMYDRAFRLVDRLFRNQCAQSNDEASSVMLIDDSKFEQKIVPAKRTRLRKFRSDFQFKKMPLSHISLVHRFLKKCRKERGQTLSLSLSQMTRLAEAIPKHLQLFCVYAGDQLVSAAVVLQESPQVWYTFYYGHLSAYDRQSPVVFLLEQLYDTAKKEGIQWLNLGTSMLDNKINYPLLHFKKSLGAVTTIKRTYIQQL